MQKGYLKHLSHVSYRDLTEVGGKAASLGEMIQASLPVPDGFVVTTKAYSKFYNKLFPKEFEEEILSEALLGEMIHADLPVSPGFAASTTPYKNFFNTQFSNEIMKNFKKLGTNRVAVRSSAIAEDSLIASWAGQLESYLNVGEKDLLTAIKNCWQSADSVRVVSYAELQKETISKLTLAVIIQKMVTSEISGVMFTQNPVSNDSNEIMIEAGYGLGELIVQGEITPDNYVVEKDTLKITKRTRGFQTQMLVYQKGENKRISVPEKLRNTFVLNKKQLKDLANLGKHIESYYHKPQDIEWAIAKEKIFVVQSRPITTL